MFQRFSQVEGFTYQEVLLCFGVTLMEFSLAESFARGFDTFSDLVNKGEFDRILVRPSRHVYLWIYSQQDHLDFAQSDDGDLYADWWNCSIFQYLSDLCFQRILNHRKRQRIIC